VQGAVFRCCPRLGAVRQPQGHTQPFPADIVQL
jgi:hypothetical protein